jgi:hypothetical protein
MVIFLPLLLMLLVLSAVRGETNIILVLPMCLTLALGAVYVAIALRDGRPKKDPSIPRPGHQPPEPPAALSPEDETARATRALSIKGMDS